jgi:hypothetical protein
VIVSYQTCILSGSTSPLGATGGTIGSSGSSAPYYYYHVFTSTGTFTA